MVKKNEDVLVSFLLDRTGSMASVTSDVIGGFNAFVDEQAEKPGKCRFVFTLFDSTSIDVKDFASVSEVPHLTNQTYVPRSTTNLLDAIGKTIDLISNLKKLPKKVLFIIYTDGQENASKEYTRAGVKALVEKKEKEGWDFVFMGADIDAYAESHQFGVNAGQTVAVNSGATGQSMGAMSAMTTTYRDGGTDYTAPLKAEEKRQKTEAKKKK